ncbi:hypothetical protein HK405_006743, partial [Cladochytrium tenue]
MAVGSPSTTASPPSWVEALNSTRERAAAALATPLPAPLTPGSTAATSAAATRLPTLLVEHARLAAAHAYLVRLRAFDRAAAAAEDALLAAAAAASGSPPAAALLAAVSTAVELCTGTAESAIPGHPPGGGGAVSSITTAEAGGGSRPPPDVDLALDRHMDAAVDDLLRRTTALMKSHLSKALSELGWPATITSTAITKAGPSVIQSFRAAFADALALHRLMYRLHKKDRPSLDALLPIQIMADALIKRLRFHFLGSKPTNRLDKPEWLLQHISKLAKEHAEFIDGEVQDILDNNGFQDRDAATDFLQCLVMFARYKFQLDMPDLYTQPHLLLHTVSEFISFDRRSMQVGSLFSGQPGSRPWTADGFSKLAVLTVVANDSNTFRKWVGAEREAAREKFESIMDSDPWSSAFDDEMEEMTGLVPTKSAEAVMDLIGTITVLRAVQLDLLEEYLDRVRKAVNSYESTFLPLQSGVGSKRQYELIRYLCRAASSLAFVRDALLEMEESLFFIELSEFARERGEVEEPSESVFSRTIKVYGTVEARILDLIAEDCLREFVEAFWKYDKKSDWDSDDAGPSPTPPTAELSEAVGATLGFVAAVTSSLPGAARAHALRDLAGRVARHVWQRVVARRVFSPAGARQLRADVEHVWVRLFEGRLPTVPVEYR